MKLTPENRKIDRTSNLIPLLFTEFAEYALQRPLSLNLMFLFQPNATWTADRMADVTLENVDVTPDGPEVDANNFRVTFDARNTANVETAHVSAPRDGMDGTALYVS